VTPRKKKQPFLAKRPLKVLYLTHPEMVPPDSVEGLSEQEFKHVRSDHDIVTCLREDLGHTVHVLGVADDLGAIRRTLHDFQPDIAWNSLEFFHNEPMWDHGIPSWLELMKVPYTGINPRGLVLSRGKALSKRLVAPYRILTPDHFTVLRGRPARRPKGIGFPLIVKSLTEHASMGISRASVVDSDERLAERVQFIHEKIRTDAIVEQYIDGRELYVGVLGMRRIQVLPTWELLFENLPAGAPRVATAHVKRNTSYQDKAGIFQAPADDVDELLGPRIAHVSKRIYRAFEFDAYARLDFRLDAENRLWFLEANANPDMGRHEEFAEAALHAGIPYPVLIQRVLNLGMLRHGLAWSGEVSGGA
jgi:D-alanine-D-alanine ligase